VLPLIYEEFGFDKLPVIRVVESRSTSDLRVLNVAFYLIGLDY
jgi:hypothetical protein